METFLDHMVAFMHLQYELALMTTDKSEERHTEYDVVDATIPYNNMDPEASMDMRVEAQRQLSQLPMDDQIWWYTAGDTRMSLWRVLAYFCSRSYPTIRLGSLREKELAHLLESAEETPTNFQRTEVIADICSEIEQHKADLQMRRNRLAAGTNMALRLRDWSDRRQLAELVEEMVRQYLSSSDGRDCMASDPIRIEQGPDETTAPHAQKRASQKNIIAAPDFPPFLAFCLL